MNEELGIGIGRIYAALGETTSDDASRFHSVVRRGEDGLLEASVGLQGDVPQLQNSTFAAVHNTRLTRQQPTGQVIAPTATLLIGDCG